MSNENSKWGSYVYVEPEKAKPGSYRISIVSAEEGKSKTSGNDMITVGFKLNGTNITVNNYFVKNEYFNKNISRFFDAFPMLKGENNEGNFDFLTWIGCVGAAKFKEDGEYLKLDYFLTPEKAENLPAWVGEMPERQTVTDFQETNDELPF